MKREGAFEGVRVVAYLLAWAVITLLSCVVGLAGLHALRSRRRLGDSALQQRARGHAHAQHVHVMDIRFK